MTVEKRTSSNEADARPQAKKVKRSTATGGSKPDAVEIDSGDDEGPSHGKAAVWPTAPKLHLFRTIFEKGRASMSKEDWAREAKETGKSVRALKDQLKRGLKPKIEECIQSGQV